MIVTFVSQHSQGKAVYHITSNLFISKKAINAEYVIIKQHKRVVYMHMSRMFIKRVKILIVVNVTNLFKRDV